VRKPLYRLCSLEFGLREGVERKVSSALVFVGYKSSIETKLRTFRIKKQKMRFEIQMKVKFLNVLLRSF
jgi:hypothetical protein